MAALLSGERLRFLFRTEQGRIGRQDWLSGAVLLALVLAVFTAAWFALEPYANRGLDERALIDPMTIAAYAYLLGFALVIMLVAASFAMLSIKWLRAIGRPTALAGLLPFMALLDGSAHWLQPRVAEVMSRVWVYGADVLLIAVVVWAVYEMGLRDGDSTKSE